MLNNYEQNDIEDAHIKIKESNKQEQAQLVEVVTSMSGDRSQQDEATSPLVNKSENINTQYPSNYSKNDPNSEYVFVPICDSPMQRQKSQENSKLSIFSKHQSKPQIADGRRPTIQEIVTSSQDHQEDNTSQIQSVADTQLRPVTTQKDSRSFNIQSKENLNKAYQNKPIDCKTFQFPKNIGAGNYRMIDKKKAHMNSQMLLRTNQMAKRKEMQSQNQPRSKNCQSPMIMMFNEQSNQIINIEGPKNKSKKILAPQIIIPTKTEDPLALITESDHGATNLQVNNSKSGKVKPQRIGQYNILNTSSATLGRSSRNEYSQRNLATKKDSFVLGKFHENQSQQNQRKLDNDINSSTVKANQQSQIHDDGASNSNYNSNLYKGSEKQGPPMASNSYRDTTFKASGRHIRHPQIRTHTNNTSFSGNNMKIKELNDQDSKVLFSFKQENGAKSQSTRKDQQHIPTKIVNQLKQLNLDEVKAREDPGRLRSQELVIKELEEKLERQTNEIKSATRMRNYMNFDVSKQDTVSGQDPTSAKDRGGTALSDSKSTEFSYEKRNRRSLLNKTQKVVQRYADYSMLSNPQRDFEKDQLNLGLKKSRQRLILNLGQSYNIITLERIQKQKKDLFKKQGFIDNQRYKSSSQNQDLVQDINKHIIKPMTSEMHSRNISKLQGMKDKLTSSFKDCQTSSSKSPDSPKTSLKSKKIISQEEEINNLTFIMSKSRVGDRTKSTSQQIQELEADARFGQKMFSDHQSRENTSKMRLQNDQILIKQKQARSQSMQMFKNYKYNMKLIKKEKHKNLLRVQRGYADKYAIGDDLDVQVEPIMSNKQQWTGPIHQQQGILKIGESVEQSQQNINGSQEEKINQFSEMASNNNVPKRLKNDQADLLRMSSQHLQNSGSIDSAEIQRLNSRTGILKFTQSGSQEELARESNFPKRLLSQPVSQERFQTQINSPVAGKDCGPSDLNELSQVPVWLQNSQPAPAHQQMVEHKQRAKRASKIPLFQIDDDINFDESQIQNKGEIVISDQYPSPKQMKKRIYPKNKRQRKKSLKPEIGVESLENKNPWVSPACNSKVMLAQQYSDGNYSKKEDKDDTIGSPKKSPTKNKIAAPKSPKTPKSQFSLSSSKKNISRNDNIKMKLSWNEKQIQSEIASPNKNLEDHYKADFEDVTHISVMTKDMNATLVSLGHEINRVYSPRSHRSTYEEENEGQEISEAQRLKAQFELLHRRHQENQNTTIKMKAVNSDIQFLNQTCNKLVSNINNMPIISQDLIVPVFVAPSLEINYRLEIKGLCSPLRVTVKKQDPKTNYELYMSTINKEPNLENNEMYLFNKNHFFVHAENIGTTSQSLKNQEKRKSNQAGMLRSKQMQQNKTHHPDGMPLFQDTYLYLAFKSNTGCSLQFRYNQTESRAGQIRERLTAIKKLYEKEGKKDIDLDDPYYLEMQQLDRDLQQERDEFKKCIYADKKKYITGQSQDFKSMRFNQWNEDRRIVRQRKSEMDICDLKMNLFKLNKWDLLKHERLEMFVYFTRKFNKQKGCQDIIQLMKLRGYLSEIWDVFLVNHTKHVMDFKAKVIQIMIRYNFLKMVSCRGDTLIKRNQCLARDLISAIGLPIHEVKYRKSEIIFRDLMMRWSWKRVLRDNCVNLCLQAKRIITNIRRANEVRRNRKGVLQGEIWDEELMKLCVILTGPDSNANQKQAWQSISKITDEKKRQIANIYMNRQKIHNRIAFMEWYIAEQEKKYDVSIGEGLRYHEKYYAYQAIVPGFKKLLAHFDQFLDKDPAVNKCKIAEKKAKKKAVGRLTITSKASIDKQGTYVTQMDLNSPEFGSDKSSKQNNLQKKQTAKPKNMDIRGQGSQERPNVMLKLLMHKSSIGSMPTFILLQPNKKNLVKKLILKAGLSMKKGPKAFDTKVANIIAQENLWNATDFIRYVEPVKEE